MSSWNDVGQYLEGNTGNDAAQDDLSGLSATLKNYYNPYMNAGTSEIQPYQNTVNTLMQDPTGFVNNIMQSYKPSQMNQNNMNLMQTASDHAAAVGGTLGTGEQVGEVQKNANNLSMGDQQQYLQQILAPFYQGLNGASNIFGSGLNATNSLGNNLSTIGQSQANLAQKHGDNIDDMITGGLTTIGSWL